MRIAFIASGLEPGRDGVGDYTRRLACECIRQGHPSIIVGLNDSMVSQTGISQQEMEGISVSVLRLPRSTLWHKRMAEAADWLNGFDPDWVSLQFVPFGFHPKGLSFELPSQLASMIGRRPLHWMFHELWILWSLPLSLRKRVLGQAQKLCLRTWLRRLKPRAVATQLPLYQTALRKLGVGAEIVPLHGNIPVYPSAEAAQWLTHRCGAIAEGKCIKAGFFGNILSTLDRSLLAARLAELKVPGDELLVLTAGKIGGESSELWNALAQELAASATFAKLGELNEREASLYFSALDYGLTSYPAELVGKSGSAAAMCEHGLPVIACGSMTGDSVGPAMNGGPVHKAAPWTVKQTALALINQLQQAKL